MSAQLVGRLLALSSACEMSWSFTGQGCDRRALIMLPVGRAETEALWAAASAYGFSGHVLERSLALLPEADALGLGLGRESRSVRLYLQFWQRLAARVEAGDLRPDLLYVGFKRHEGGPVRADPYHCRPLAPESEFLPPLLAALVGFGLPEAQMRRFLAPLTPESCIFTRTETAARRAWLATLRRARLDDRLLRQSLADLPARDGLTELIAALDRAPLVHIAGGTDDTKGAFVTFYTEATQHEVAGFLADLGATVP